MEPKLDVSMERIPNDVGMKEEASGHGIGTRLMAMAIIVVRSFAVSFRPELEVACDHFSFEIVACLLVDRMTDVFVRPIVLATARHREEQPLTSFDDLDAFDHERILECEAERRFQLRVLTEEHPDLGDSHCRLPQVSHEWGGPILQPCEPTSRAGHGPRV